MSVEAKNTILGLVLVLLLFLVAVSGRPVGCLDGEYNYDHPGAC